MKRGWYWVRTKNKSMWFPAYFWPGMYFPWNLRTNNESWVSIPQPTVVGTRIEEPEKFGKAQPGREEGEANGLS